MAQHLLGIDVGYSKTRLSTGLCLLSIDGGVLRWQRLNTGSDEAIRLHDLRSLIPKGTHLLGVGIDGPLTPRLRVVSHYRTSDALLSRGSSAFGESLLRPARPPASGCTVTPPSWLDWP